MGHWGRVHQRAWRETRELLRLDQPGRIFLYFTGAIVPPVILVIVEGRVDAAVKGLAVAGALLIAGLAIYLFKVLVTPGRVAQEAAQAHDQEVTALRDRLAAALNPSLPPDAAEALYQRQGRVATVTGSLAPDRQTRTFDLEDSAALDLATPFWFGDELFIATRTRMAIAVEIDLQGAAHRDVKRGVETILLGTTASLRRA